MTPRVLSSGHEARTRQSLRRSFRFSSLESDQLSLLHEASLEILARTGVRFFNQEALSLFQHAGASVSDGTLVRIPAHLVERALRSAPKNIAIYNRNGSQALNVGGHLSYFGVGCDTLYIYDLENGQRRRALLNDVVAASRLVDALPNLDFVMSMFMPSDVPMETFEKHQMAIMLRESTKPIVFVGANVESTENAARMAAVVCGGLDEVQRRPFILNYINPVSAFHHHDDAVQRLLRGVELGIPTIYLPGNARGTTAPFTPAGAIALGNAGQLAGLVLAQLKREGAPIVRNNTRGGGIDFRTMAEIYMAPNLGGFGWDLGRHYGMPMFGTAGCTDAKLFDAQAAAEAALSLMANAIGGANLIHDCGYMNGGLTGSLELVTFCDDLIGWIRTFLNPLEITEETLALDLIHQVGPDGNFLDSEHTLRHCRDDWQPTLMDHQNYESWAAAGGSTAQERAARKVRRLVAAPHAPSLPEGVLVELQAIVERADAHAVGR